MPKNKVTIREVAARAGVSISTVSLVLNNQDPVSPETREAVKEAVRELGYVKNSLAASMKSGHSKMIVAIVPDFINDFFTSAIRGIEEVVSQNGYVTLVFTTNEAQDKEAALLGGEIGKMIEGAVLIPAVDDEAFYRHFGKPIVLLDRTVGMLDAVVVDNHKGAYIATHTLIEAGHRKIALINGDKDFRIGSERRRGYYDAMRDAGLPIVPAYIKQGHWYEESGYQLTQELLQLADPPTAIFAANSQICIGCINYLREHHLRIGKDISLISFDDTLLARISTPGVTVIDRPTTEMGREAARVLLDAITTGRRQQRREVLDVRLIRRDSIARLPENL